MLFQRFLKKRKQAVVDAQQAAAAKNQETLAEQAQHHADATARRDAVVQLLQVGTLRRILEQDGDAGVRDAARARFLDLLCSDEREREPLATLLEEFARIDRPEIVETIALKGALPELRRAAIERVQSPAALALCAVQDGAAGNRGCAVERLEDKAALEQVVRQIGKRDKNVHRRARDKLRLIAEQEERPRRIHAQCDELCAKAERLGRLGHWSQDRALLEHLEHQWAAIDGEPEPGMTARFQAERTRFLDAYGAHCRENAAQIAEQEAHSAIRVQREALLRELSNAIGESDEMDLQALRERIATDWKSLPRLPAQSQRQLDARYDEIVRILDGAQKTQSDRRHSVERLERIASAAQQLLAESKPLDSKDVKRLLERGRSTAATLSDPAASAPFLALAEQLESRLTQQQKHAEQRLRQLPERLAELESHLAGGELKKAEPLYQSLQAGIALIQASGLQRDAVTNLSNRLRTLSPQLRDLHNWRRWGADQHREGLCADMEALIDRELPLETVTEQLRALQKDWKGLDKTGSPANHALWARFHRASDSVYERCRPYMEVQAAERETNRIARERVCQQLEDFLSNVDWERVDWKRILRAERDTRQTWAAIGPTDSRHRRPLENRFHRALKNLDQRLDAERRRNQALKQNLIGQVRTLAELPDLEAAIERTKALQREWRTTVPARQRDENKLWQDFRAACDAVFERRAALQQAHAHELHDNLIAREAICREALALATSEPDPKRLAAAEREFIERWRAREALPVPRQAAAQLNQQWQQARKAMERRRQEREDEQRQAALDLLQRQAALCERLELSLLGEMTDVIEPTAALQLWQQLAHQPDNSLQQALNARFELAQSAAQDPARLAELRKRFSENARLKNRLCLQLEIIAGVESPPDLAQQRLEFQVARLAERMVEGEDTPPRGATGLLHDWYLTGPAPLNEELNARFDHACRQLALKTAPDAAPA